MTGPNSSSGTRVAGFILLALFFCRPGGAQQVENGLLRVGGFRCASVKPQANDPSFDLYKTGYWNYTGFRMEVWRRLGIPFWYPKGTGVVRVAGEGWRPELGDDVSSAQAGGKAVEQSDGRVAEQRSSVDPHDAEERAAINAIDQDKSTAWQPAEETHRGKLIVTFGAPAHVNQLRFRTVVPAELRATIRLAWFCPMEPRERLRRSQANTRWVALGGNSRFRESTPKVFISTCGRPGMERVRPLSPSLRLKEASSPNPDLQRFRLRLRSR